jgi:hypothetical protein
MRHQLREALAGDGQEWARWNARREQGKPVLTAVEAAALLPYGRLVGGDDIQAARRYSLAKNHVEPRRPSLRVLVIESVDYYADRIVEGLEKCNHQVTWIVGAAGSPYSYMGTPTSGLTVFAGSGAPANVDVYPNDFDVALVSDVVRGHRPALEIVRWLTGHNVLCIGLTETGNPEAVEAGGAATVFDKGMFLQSIANNAFFALLVRSLTSSAR